jgi:hypothetical protein
MGLRKVACAVAAACLLAACASAPTCAAGEEPAVAEWLYFGTARPGGVVGPDEWDAFLRDAVTPRFPSGLTAWPASGQWRGADGKVTRELSHVLNLLHPADAASEQGIRAIVAEYKQRFQQEAVLRVRAPACMSL